VPDNNVNNEDKLDSVIKRLERLETEVSQIKQAINPPRQNIRPTPPPPAAPPPAMHKPADVVIPSIPKGSIESAIGTKWIGRIGMVAVVFGIAFFLKYSFDNKLIGETGRIILGIISGACFIGIGEYFQKWKQWKIYGQILTGGGLAILYFSIYAAFAFYHLIPQLLAFAVLIVITTTGIILSIRYSALSIVTIGILGGFLTPIMLSTGENRPISLFAYILLLDAGIIAVASYKNWRSLGIASLVGTILMYIAWHAKFYTLDQQPLAFIIVTVFYLFYNIYVLCLSSKQKTTEADNFNIILAATFYFIAFIAQNDAVNNWNFKFFVPALSLVAILFAGLARNLNRDHSITYCFVSISVILTVIAAFVVFEKEWISAVLATEMVVFAYLGIRFNKDFLRLVSNLLVVISIIRFFMELMPELGPFDNMTLILNSRFLICSFIIAAFYLLLLLYTRKKDLMTKAESAIIPIILIITQILSVVLLSIEFYDFYGAPTSDKYLAFAEFANARQLSLSLIWIIYASILTAIGMIRRSRILRILGILLIGITVLKVFLFDLAALETVYRIISFVILGFALLIVSYFYNRFKHYIFGEDNHE
jgi:uncharacterized membrane protein